MIMHRHDDFPLVGKNDARDQAKSDSRVASV
jgi:hypothetical protein